MRLHQERVERYRQIHDLSAKKVDLANIARQVGISRQSVYAYLKMKEPLARTRIHLTQRRSGHTKAEQRAEKEASSLQERRQPPLTRRLRSQQPAPGRYPSDLSDQEWVILQALIPPAKPGGRPRSVDMREVLNAILYLDRTGAQWWALPRDFPAWSTVWTYFRTWRNDGTWERIHTTLREQVRVKQGREPTPSAAIIDSQSVKTSQKGGLAATMAARR